jgi:hypothetical protein
MFFSSIVRSISCTDEKNQNNHVPLRSDLHRNCPHSGAETGGDRFLARSALKRQTRSNQRLAVPDLITIARDPRLCYENYFQSISHRLRGRLTQKQGEK